MLSRQALKHGVIYTMNKALQKILQTWIPTVIISVAIAYLSLVPYEETGDLLENYDLLMHFAAYFAFGIFLYFPVKRVFHSQSGLKIAVYIVVIGLLLGSVLEIAQHLSPGRTPSVIDALSNLAGVAFSQVLVTFFFVASHRGHD
jgi:VanZ family protein